MVVAASLEGERRAVGGGGGRAKVGQRPRLPRPRGRHLVRPALVPGQQGQGTVRHLLNMTSKVSGSGGGMRVRALKYIYKDHPTIFSL